MTDTLISFETAKLAKEKGFAPEFDWLNQNTFPTQSLLQKWLREVHDIHIIVKVFWDSKFNIRTYAADIFKIGQKPIQRKRIVRPTFESALEDGLFESLKLIP